MYSAIRANFRKIFSRWRVVPDKNMGLNRELRHPGTCGLLSMGMQQKNKTDVIIRHYQKLIRMPIQAEKHGLFSLNHRESASDQITRFNKKEPDVFSPGSFHHHIYGRLNAPTRKTAICARLTGVVGQNLPPPHPPVIPSADNCSIHGAAQ